MLERASAILARDLVDEPMGNTKSTEEAGYAVQN
jgi:hypothetical protein